MSCQKVIKILTLTRVLFLPDVHKDNGKFFLNSTKGCYACNYYFCISIQRSCV